MLQPRRIFLSVLFALLLICGAICPAARAAEAETSSAEASAESSAAEDAGSSEEQLRAAALYEDSIDDDDFWDTYHSEFADDAEYVQWYNYYNDEDEEEELRAAEEEESSAAGEEELSAQSSSSPFISGNYTHADSKAGMTVSHGIDVSKWQGSINWAKVKASGVEFVFIRCGYTGTVSKFSMAEDPKFASNIQGAYNAGIKVGVYYFSQAKTVAEAQKEADKVNSIISSYKSMISLPVVCDYETAARIKGIKKTQGTKNVLAFCQRIAAYGYTAYYYGNPDDLKTICDYTQMTAYGCWLANYTTQTKFTGPYDFWQYTSSGKVSGISSRVVDCNFWYQTAKGVTLSTPVLSSVSCVNGGVKLTWSAVTGAEKYRVFRKTESGSWEKLGDTTSTSYTDKTPSSGTYYYYTVRCINSTGTKHTSGYDADGLGIQYLAAPTLTGISGSSSKVTLKWKKVSGAVKYRVFRRTGNGSWKKLADTTSLSYSDSTISVNANYTYTVRCVSSDGRSYASGYDATGLSIRCAETPSLSSASNTSSGVKLKWSAAKGAALYKVFRKTGSGSWTALGYTTSTSYTDKKASNGKTYIYTVRCVSADKKYYTSAYNADGLSCCYLSRPTLKSASSKSSGAITVKWKKNSKATGYQISYTTGSTTETVSVSGASTTSKTITGLKSGKTYKIKVRAQYDSSYSAWSKTKKAKVK